MRTLLGVLAATTVLALGACSSGTAGDAGGSSDAGGHGTLNVTDSTGRVALDGPAKRVVALEWSYVEDLLTVGVTPVGVADRATYNTWVKGGPKLPASVPDVGGRAQPSLEKIKALHPDVIVAEKSRSTANRAELRKIAPVLLFDSYSPKDALVTNMTGTFLRLGRAVGRSDQAARVVGDYQKTVSDAKARLVKAGKDGTEVTLLQGFSVNGQPSIRAYTDHAQAVQVLASIGLHNAWHGKDSDPSGFTATGVEGLDAVSDSTVLYVAQASDDPFAGALAHNATWRRLGFVRHDRVHALDPGTWFWGGPKSDEMLIDQALDALGA
ncbi:MAG: iron-siderophore ABC transporter substrate-binding protein [Actinocatenispora sp.]